jgi:hypothetical protein
MQRPSGNVARPPAPIILQRFPRSRACADDLGRIRFGTPLSFTRATLGTQ